jgi:hypothetical protein
MVAAVWRTIAFARLHGTMARARVEWIRKRRKCRLVSVGDVNLTQYSSVSNLFLMRARTGLLEQDCKVLAGISTIIRAYEVEDFSMISQFYVVVTGRTGMQCYIYCHRKRPTLLRL